MRRAKLNVTVASVEAGPEVTCSRGVRLIADGLLSEYAGETYDCIALPGGLKGAEMLANTDDLIRLIKNQLNEGRLVGAICAAPAVVLSRHGLLKVHGTSEHYLATCYPSFLKELPNPSKNRVVVDRNLITSQGPATAIEFSEALIEHLVNKEEAESVVGAMLLQKHQH